jgi:general secretion pathway protein L
MVPDRVAHGVGFSSPPVIVREANASLSLIGPSGNDAGHVMGRLDDVNLPKLAGQLLTTFDSHRTPLEIELEQRHVLSRTITIPRSAETELEGVISFEIERHTPYRGDEVYFVYQIDRRASDDKNLSVNLTILPKATVTNLFLALGENDYSPRLIRISSEGDALIGPQIFGRRALQLPSPTPDQVARRMAIAAVIFGLIAITAPLISLSNDAATLRDALAQANTQAGPTVQLRRQIDTMRQAAEGVIQAKGGTPTVIHTLNALSNLMPDGTWLRQVSLVENELVIEGLTDSASKLVGLLESAPQFTEISYTAPVTRERGGKLERFSFSMKLQKIAP